MMESIYRDYLLATLEFIVKMSKSGHLDYLLRMGLKPEQIQTLGNMSVDHLVEIALFTSGMIVDIKVDADSVDLTLNLLRRRDLERRINLALIRAGASFEIMNRLTGIDATTFSAHRKMESFFGRNVGRPPEPSEEEQNSIWRAWHETAPEKDVKDRLLEVYEKTGLQLRVVWRYLQKNRLLDRYGLSSRDQLVDLAEAEAA